ncbi:MAG: hypothetical protein JWL72_4023 [Ilumatobacteraceae bacterium]|nr:hypothetical protein [Ilumatobacteraceae bacterium]MCU1390685.1 hypothetical protein [Ilumatobacteraceae bacterium]
MKNPIRVASGALMTLLGLLFMFQGLGVVHGSTMTNSTFWAIAGPVIAVAGLILVASGLGRLGPGSSRPSR